jgi:hypothetical protein
LAGGRRADLCRAGQAAKVPYNLLYDYMIGYQQRTYNVFGRNAKAAAE